MRRTLILTLAVLLSALALCALAHAVVGRTADEALRLQSLSVLAAQLGERQRAEVLLAILAGHWRDRAPLLETLASHDALHEVSRVLDEALICLECEDHDDFLRTISQVKAGLEHLKDEQAMSWANLY